MTKRLAAVFVGTALRRGKHEAAVLDRARAQENVPMGFAGLARESGRHRDQRSAGIGERAEQGGKRRSVSRSSGQAAQTAGR